MSRSNMTASRYRAWHRCARLHEYEYERRYQPVKKARALAFGTLFHRALETWWLGWRDSQGGDTALSRALGVIKDAPDELGDYDLVVLDVLMRGYHARWASVMDEIEVISVEQTFVGPLVDLESGQVSSDFRQKGKIDVVCRIGGQVWLVEHKTSSADLGPSSSYWTKLRMDPQVSIYVDGAGLLGHDDVAGCLYDVVGKPTIRPHKATPEKSRKYTQGKACKACKDEPAADCDTCQGTGWKELPRLYKGQRERDESLEEFRDRLIDAVTAEPNRYYQRAQVVRLDHELDEARRDLWETAELIRAQSGRPAPRNSDACFRYGGPCAFFDVCSGAASLEDPTRFVQLRGRGRQLERNAA